MPRRVTSFWTPDVSSNYRQSPPLLAGSFCRRQSATPDPHPEFPRPDPIAGCERPGTKSNVAMFLNGAGQPIPGIDIAGPLPGDLQLTVVFGAALTSNANTDAAKALISFLRTPEAADVIKAKGMEPS
jgi:hypothetical protein